MNEMLEHIQKEARKLSTDDIKNQKDHVESILHTCMVYMEIEESKEGGD